MKRCVTAYGKCCVCKCSLDLTLPYRRNIRSPAVTRCRIPGTFVTKFKISEIDHIPDDYLVTLFIFGRFIRWGNPSYRRFLKNKNSIIAIFTKSTWHFTVLETNNPLLRYRYLLSECQKVRDLRKNCHTSQGKLYPCLSY